MYGELVFLIYRIAQNFDGGKVDEFDKWMLNCQNFPYQNFALRKFLILILINKRPVKKGSG